MVTVTVTVTAGPATETVTATGSIDPPEAPPSPHRWQSGNPMMDAVWRLPQPQQLSWRTWHAEVVVYNDETGNTHRLGPLASEIFETLLARPATRVELVQYVARTLNLEITEELHEAVTQAIEQFREFGLVDSLEGSQASIAI